MRFGIIYSEKDFAGINIVNQLKKISFSPQILIIKLKKETIFSKNLNIKSFPKLKNLDFVIFASKHESEKKTLALCLHAPGNWRDAKFGGKSGEVCLTSAYVLKYLFKELNTNAKTIKKRFEITLEATHHGPLIDIPCCFIEIGSCEEQWKDPFLGKILAKTLLSLQNFNNNLIKTKIKNYVPVIGIGGPHYCPNFNKIQLKTKYAISHIIPKYVLPLTSKMLKQAESKTKEQIKKVLLDWKGLGKYKKETLDLLNRSGLRYEKI